MSAAIVHIVDDDDDVRRATGRLLAASGYETRSYARAGDFLDAAAADTRGCLILDVQLPDQSGLDLQVALAARGVTLPIIFLTGHGQIPDTVRAIQRGAVDFLTKPVDSERLLAAVSRALARDAEAQGQRERLADLRRRYERLTEREQQVVLHLIRGQLNKQVAADLNITERTIKLHRANILRKLEVGSMAELARLAIELGIEPA